MSNCCSLLVDTRGRRKKEWRGAILTRIEGTPFLRHVKRAVVVYFLPLLIIIIKEFHLGRQGDHLFITEAIIEPLGECHFKYQFM